jgi:Cell Wall Hydrolase
LAYHIQTRARARVLLATTSIGLIIAAAMGSTWLGTHLARESSLHDQAERMIEIAGQDLGEDHFLNMSAFGTEKPRGRALSTLSADEADAIDAGAMAIAMRYDPSSSPQTQGHERSAIVLAQNLISLKSREPGRKWGRMSAPAATTPIVTASLSLGSFDKTSLMKSKINSASPFTSKTTNKTDAECLTQAVYFEARGEGEAGMRAVAQVILNRVRHPNYPKTICGVVYQGAAQARNGAGCQFSFTCNGTMRTNRMEVFAWKRSQSIAKDALNGYVMKAVGTSTHFHTNYVNPVWAARMDKIATIGDHMFYQYRGSTGRLVLASDKVRPSSESDQLNVASVAAPDGNAILAAPAQAPLAADQTLTASNDAPHGDLTRTLEQQAAPTQPTTVQLSAPLKGAEARTVNETVNKPVEVAPAQ